MENRLFVGNLPYRMGDADLEQAFSAHGTVISATVIRDRSSGRSRGFGFVTFEDDEAADKAIAALNGTELDGRTIRVDRATSRGGNRGGGGGGRSAAA